MSPLRVLMFVVTAFFAVTATSEAHPLGNFTTNHLSRLTLSGPTLDVRYIVDLAEIPAFSELRRLDRNARPSSAQLAAWARSTASEDLASLHVAIDGSAVVPHLVDAAASTAPGAAGLRTLRLELRATAAIPAGARVVSYRDEAYRDRIGWRDVVVNGAAEPTGGLRRYPSGLLGSPRANTTLDANIEGATLHVVRIGAADTASTAQSPSLARGDAFAALLDRDVSSPFLFAGALLLAMVLGALHALEPGHGKTLLAVSLVGARATTRQAFILASSLTIAHTAGVIVLGGVVLVAARSIVPEQIYPWITLLSGAVVVVVAARGLAAQVRRLRGFDHVHVHAHDSARPHAHPHRHAEADDHHLAQAAFDAHARAHAAGTAHDHDALDDEAHARLHAIPGTTPLTFRSALLAAVTGNIAPCPAALVVLLAAVASHRIAFGLALIVAFSIGLAGILTGLGIAVVRGASWLSQRPAFDRFARRAPLVTALVIAVIGSVLLAQGLVAEGVSWPVPATAALVLAAIAGYAFSPFRVHAHQHREIPA